jgi:hypothetical protein
MSLPEEVAAGGVSIGRVAVRDEGESRRRAGLADKEEPCD